jgi:hypothetical protein
MQSIAASYIHPFEQHVVDQELLYHRQVQIKENYLQGRAAVGLSRTPQTILNSSDNPELRSLLELGQIVRSLQSSAPISSGPILDVQASFRLAKGSKKKMSRSSVTTMFMTTVTQHLDCQVTFAKQNVAGLCPRAVQCVSSRTCLPPSPAIN